MHRFQISVFGAIAIVYAVEGVQKGIYAADGALNAMSAGWLILALVDILWVLYFTAEEDSLVLHLFNSTGTGGLTPPSRRRRTRTNNSVHMSTNGGYATNYASGGIGSDMYNTKAGSGTVGGAGTYGGPGGLRSTGSFTSGGGGDVRDKSLGGAGSVHNVGTTGAPGSFNDPSVPGSPLGAGVAGIGGGNSQPLSETTTSSEPPAHKAKALYACTSISSSMRCHLWNILPLVDTASPDDSNELSFNKGDILDVLDKQGKWWSARRADGVAGSMLLCLAILLDPSDYYNFQSRHRIISNCYDEPRTLNPFHSMYYRLRLRPYLIDGAMLPTFAPRISKHSLHGCTLCIPVIA